MSGALSVPLPHVGWWVECSRALHLGLSTPLAPEVRKGLCTHLRRPPPSLLSTPRRLVQSFPQVLMLTQLMAPACCLRQTYPQSLPLAAATWRLESLQDPRMLTHSFGTVDSCRLDRTAKPGEKPGEPFRVVGQTQPWPKVPRLPGLIIPNSKQLLCS